MALVLTLAFVVMLSILMVGMAASMRSDRAAAVSHSERTRAHLMAQAATDSVVATLRQNTVDPARNWVTQPGQMYVGSETDLTGTPHDERKILQATPKALSSGLPDPALYTSIDPVLDTPNLNVTTLRDPNSHLVTEMLDDTGVVVRMPLKWVYIRKSGAIDAREPGAADPLDTADASDPIVGRYAYWADDESSKLNYNIAWGRAVENTYDRCHASKIDLTGIPGINSDMAKQIRAAILNGGQGLPAFPLMPGVNQQYHFFNTPEDARRLENPDEPIRAALNNNKFELTHYNHDPDTTFFGDDRILLTTNKNLVPHITDENGNVIYLRKFIDILRDGPTPLDAKTYELPYRELSPGIRYHIAGGQYDFSDGIWQERTKLDTPNKVDATVNMLVDYIKRTNWPVPSGAQEMSFKKKYYQNDPDDARIAQIAVNIINYVCAKESPWHPSLDSAYQLSCNPRFVADLHPTIPGKVVYHLLSGGQRGTYASTSRNFTVTEMGAWIDNAPKSIPGIAGNCYECRFRMEILIPRRYGIAGLNVVPDTSAAPAKDSWGWFANFTEVRDRFNNPSIPNYFYRFPNGRTNDAKQFSTNTNSTGYATGVRIFAADIVSGGYSEDGNSSGTWMLPGRPMVIEKIFYRTISPQGRILLDMRAGMSFAQSDDRGAIQRTIGKNNMDHGNVGLLVPAAGQQYDTVRLPISVPSTAGWSAANAALVKVAATPGYMSSMENDDPRTGAGNGDWFSSLSATGNTFGSINSISTVGKAPTQSGNGRPQQDTDIDGRITDASVYMPPPAGRTITYRYPDGSQEIDDNRVGRVTSVAELGFIFTGLDAKNIRDQQLLNPTDPQRSICYRSLRLQPNNYSNTDVLPDWILADLFAVPRVNTNQRVPNTSTVLEPNSVADPCSPLYTPHGALVGGRVNLNSNASPFAIKRLYPIASVFKGAKSRHESLEVIPAGSASDTDNPDNKTAYQIAKNIYDKTLAANGGKRYGIPEVFDSTGEICEIRGIADGGEASERLLQDVIDLTTIRGGVFSVYSIGQAVKQTRNGKLIVMGEQRQQSMVERYVDDGGTPANKNDDVVRFKTVYYRNLTP